jgi:hypothetical protein
MAEDDLAPQAADQKPSQPLQPAQHLPQPEQHPPRSDTGSGSTSVTEFTGAGPSHPRQRGVPRLVLRLVILLGLLSIGLVTGIWAIVLFPSRSQVVTPGSFIMLVFNQTGVSSVSIEISPEGGSAERVELSADSENRPRSSSRAKAVVALIFLENVSVKKCPAGAFCSIEKFHLRGIGIPISADPNSTKNYTFVISNAHLGFSSNGESAVADLPTVYGEGQAGADAGILAVSYKIQDASSYDWSVPPLGIVAGYVGWTESLSLSSSTAAPSTEVQPSEITGTNHAAEAQDSRDTFISGVLLGVAGGAVIAATQEGLHLLVDDRNGSKRRKPRRPATRPE